MKPLTLIFAGTMLCAAPALHAQINPVYLNINSHNETDDPNDYSQASVYFQVKQVVLNIADTINTYGGRWNLQAESNFILADITHENAGTNPNDLLDSLDALTYVEVDPHNHFSPTFNPYNYADLAYLLDSAGLNGTRSNMGGFLWQTPGDWMPYQLGDTGYTFSHFIWQPNVVWGGGSPGHVNDYNAYGIWKPSGAGPQFGVHNPSRHLTCIGNGCSNVISDSVPVQENIQQIIELVNFIAQQPYDPNAFWTASIQFNFRDIYMPGLADSIGVIMRALQPYVNSGQIVWSTLTEKYNTWYSAHTNPQDYFLWTCDSLPLQTEEISVASNEVQFFPNPVVDRLYIYANDYVISSVTVLDASGKMIWNRKESYASYVELNVQDWTPGMYIVLVDTQDGRRVLKKIIR